ncbi:hypothetical protein V3C99_018553 [Haemonchus contortus]
MDDGDADRLPVFLSVSEIEFPVSELSARRVITIYNPYGHPIQYKVLCNAPVNYAVPNSKGVLMAKSCKDLVVKCTARLTVGTRDRLRIEIMRPGETEILGARDILLRTVSECDAPFIQPTSMNSNIYAGSDRGSSRGSLQIRNESPPFRIDYKEFFGCDGKYSTSPFENVDGWAGKAWYSLVTALLTYSSELNPYDPNTFRSPQACSEGKNSTSSGSQVGSGCKDCVRALFFSKELH